MNLSSNIARINYTRLRLAYVLLLLAAIFSRTFAPIAALQSKLTAHAIFSGVALVGFCVFFVDLMQNRICIKQKLFPILAAFLGVMCVSSLVNFRYGGFANINEILWTVLAFFVLFPVDPNRKKNDVLFDIKVIGNVINAVWLVGVIISLVMFVMQVNFEVTGPTLTYTRQIGFYDGRVFGVFDDPNYASIFSLFCIVFSVWGLCLTAKRWQRIFYSCSIFLQFVYFVLAGSRSGFVSSLVVVFLASYFLSRHLLSKHRVNPLWEISYVLIGAGCVLVFVGLIFAVKSTAIHVPALLDSAPESTSAPLAPKKISLARDSLAGTNDQTSGRLRIWASALEIFKSKPILGTSPRGMWPFAKAAFPAGTIGAEHRAVHNIYLEVLVTTGIAGFAVFLALMWQIWIKIFKFLFKSWNFMNFGHILLCFSLMVTISIMGLFYQSIIFVNNFTTLIFWLFAGYALYFVQECFGSKTNCNACDVDPCSRNGSSLALEENQK